MIRKGLKGVVGYGIVFLGGFIACDSVIGTHFSKQERTPDPNFDEKNRIQTKGTKN
jgi:hypothetical protein